MSSRKLAENYSAGDEARSVVLTVPAHGAGQRLDVALARLLPEHSRSRLAQWIRGGQVTVSGRPALPRQKVRAGEQIVVATAAHSEPTAHHPEDIPLEVVYEDRSLFVINKPPGLVVHPGAGNWRGTLLNALLARDPPLAALPRAGIVHRLDKDTSGLMVVARSAEAQTDLVRQLQARTVRRGYLALVHGRVARDGKIEAAIGRHPAKRTRMAVRGSGKAAVTHYRVEERFTGATLLRCRLETGRTHQIRVHLNAIGHPLIGDPVYGKRASAIPFARQALHAEELALRHPLNGEPMHWRMEPPLDLRELIAGLRLGADSPPQGRGGRRRP